VPTSQRKIEANRANALKSTGPRSARGKRAASRNALAHGLTSRAALLPGEDSREYRRFLLGMLDELDPRGPLQEELAGEIANLSWKLRRSPGAEAILMGERHRGKDGEAPPLRVLVNMVLDKKSYDGSPASPAWLLDRYTRNLERSRASALRMLLSLQKRRREPDDPAGKVAPAGRADARRETWPVQNEANVPPDGAATQRQIPQTDAAGGDTAGDETPRGAKPSARWNLERQDEI
jgi:hypothetical protein